MKVIFNGAAKEIGRAAVLAVPRARGMEVAGAFDSHFVVHDIGMVSSDYNNRCSLLLVSSTPNKLYP